MAQTGVSKRKKKNDHANVSVKKATNSKKKSSSTAVVSDGESHQGNNNSDFVKKDQLIIPKRTVNDNNTVVENDHDGESKVNEYEYELMDTDDDDLSKPYPISDDDKDNKDNRRNPKRQHHQRKKRTSISLSLSTAKSTTLAKPTLLKTTTSLGKRPVEHDDDLDLAIPSTYGFNKKHTPYESCTPSPKPYHPASSSSPPALPQPLDSSMQEEETHDATPIQNSSQDSRFDTGSKYEVECILRHKIYRGIVLRYEVKWKGYPDSENTLEPAKLLHEDCKAFVLAYWRSLPKDIARPKNLPQDPTDSEQTAAPAKALATKSDKAKGKMKAPTIVPEVISLDDDDDDGGGGGEDDSDTIMKYSTMDDDDHFLPMISDGSDMDDDDTAAAAKESNDNDSLYGGDMDSDNDNKTEFGASSKYSSTATGLTTLGRTKKADRDASPLISNNNNDDVYKEIAKKKKITQKNMATNFKNEFQLIYSKTTKVDAETLDWSDPGLTISNILPLKTDRSQLMAYMTWPNDIKTIHLIQELHDKCPKKLCHYYEERIQICDMDS